MLSYLALLCQNHFDFSRDGNQYRCNPLWAALCPATHPLANRKPLKRLTLRILWPCPSELPHVRVYSAGSLTGRRAEGVV